MVIYDIEHLTKRYPHQATPANDDLSLQIRQGEIFGLLGDNGAGKSTLVKQLVNLVRPTSGKLHFMGQPLHDNPLRVPQMVGYMPQDGLAFNSITLGEALYFTAHLRGLSRRDATQERDRLLELWHIEKYRDRTPTQLSGGQRRLMQMAVTMAGAPPILILDEPTNDLAPERRKELWDILRQQHRDHGTTIIFITHDAIEAEKIIQRVGIMQNGKLLVVGKPSELKAQVMNQWRLELVFAPECPPVLPSHLTPIAQDSGRWLLYLPRDEATALLNHLDPRTLQDFRLYSATLEDLYLHYVTPPA
jgi:ABC-2 type transport system ATP-binding protein